MPYTPLAEGDDTVTKVLLWSAYVTVKQASVYSLSQAGEVGTCPQQNSESESRLDPALSESLSSIFDASTNLGQMMLP